MASPRTVGVRDAAVGREDGTAEFVGLLVAVDVRGVTTGDVPAAWGRLVERVGAVLGRLLGYVDVDGVRVVGDGVRVVGAGEGRAVGA